MPLLFGEPFLLLEEVEVLEVEAEMVDDDVGSEGTPANPSIRTGEGLKREWDASRMATRCSVMRRKSKACLKSSVCGAGIYKRRGVLERRIE